MPCNRNSRELTFVVFRKFPSSQFILEALFVISHILRHYKIRKKGCEYLQTYHTV